VCQPSLGLQELRFAYHRELVNPTVVAALNGNMHCYPTSPCKHHHDNALTHSHGDPQLAPVQTWSVQSVFVPIPDQADSKIESISAECIFDGEPAMYLMRPCSQKHHFDADLFVDYRSSFELGGPYIVLRL